MGKLLTSAFEYRDQRYYFRDWRRHVFSLDARQAQSIAPRLETLFTIMITGYAGTVVVALYLLVRRIFERPDAQAWMLFFGIALAISLAYWMGAFLMSYRTWNEVSRLAKMEPDDSTPREPNSTLNLISPLGMVLSSMVTLLLLAVAFGVPVTGHGV